MILTIILLLVGIALVLFGADRLTEGATGLARRFNMTELVIGLTVVAFGTSLPEFITSFMSALKGNSDISIGNIVGSNIFNALAIVGCSAAVSPIVISKSTVSKDIPFAILASLALIVVCSDIWIDGAGSTNLLSRTDGILLLGFFAVFMAYTFSIAKPKAEDTACTAQANDEAATAHPEMATWKIILFIVIGLAGLIGGGNLFVDAASKIAISLGISETIVGLTIVAVGTSLPELATSIVAARKGSSAIAIGNVVGSNIFNIFFVMGVCATISPMPVGNISSVDLMLLLVSILMLWQFSASKRLVERWEGCVMVLCYAAYMAYIVYMAIVQKSLF